MSSTPVSEFSKLKREVVTTNNIIDAYAAHGNEMIIIDIDAIRNSKYAQYVPLLIRKADNQIVGIANWKHSAKGVKTCSNITEPAKRCYEQIRIGLLQKIEYEDELIENDNMTAMRLICESVESQLEKMKTEGLITDNSKSIRKKNDKGFIRPVVMNSVKVVTPMQTTAINRDGEVEELNNFRYWINVPRKKYWNGESPPPLEQFGDVCYYNSVDKKADLTKPFYKFDFGAEFYNIDDVVYNNTTGRKSYRPLGPVANLDSDSSETLMVDNTNIHEYINKGSSIVGQIKVELCVTGRQAKLDLTFSGRNYVRSGPPYSQFNETDDDRLIEFHMNQKKSNEEYDDDEDVDFDV